MALDQDTINGFNELFESMGEPPEDDDTDDTDVDDDDQTDDDEGLDDTDDSDTEDGEEDDESDSDDDSDDSDDGDSNQENKPDTKDKQQAKQNFAFAQQRQKIKSQEALIRNLGKAIGLADGMSVEEIAGKVNEVLLTKESEKTGIPVETLQEINELRSLAVENRTLKRREEVKGNFSDLIERYNLSAESVDEFTNYLIDNGKNPIENPNIDISYEYYMLHEKDILNNAIEAALQKEEKRKSKVKDKAGNKTPGSGKGGDDSVKEIKTVADLDKYLDSLDA